MEEILYPLGGITSEVVQYQRYVHEHIPMNKKTLEVWGRDLFFYFLVVHEIGSKRLNSVSRLPCQEHDHEEEEMAESSPSKAHQEAVPVEPEPTPEEKEPEIQPLQNVTFPLASWVVQMSYTVICLLYNICWFLNMYCMCISIIYLYLHIKKLVGGFEYFLFSPLLGEDSHFD